MRKTLQIIALAVAVKALVLMVVAVLLYCAGHMSHEMAKQALSAGTVVWFAATLPLRFLGQAEV